MVGRKCTLCGGRLDSRNICVECGLNNSKSDKNYKINQSSCDGQPLTHVHKTKKENPGYGNRKQEKADPPRRPAEGNIPRKPVSVNVGRQKGNKRIASVLATLSVFFVLAGIIGSAVGGLVYDTDSGFEEEYVENVTYGDEDPYENVENELPEEGSPAEYRLESGEYIVGVHIPAGNYAAEAEDEFDTVEVEDPANNIYLYEYMEKPENNYMDDLWLYSGARVIIETDGVMKLSTENAQMSEMYGMENPLTETVRFAGGKNRTAGKDFEPGVYDLKALEGSGAVEAMFHQEEEEPEDEYIVRSFYLAADASREYKNLVLSSGMRLVFEENESLVITLTPSEKIEDTDYEGYYLYDEDEFYEDELE